MERIKGRVRLCLFYVNAKIGKSVKIRESITK